MDPVEKCSSCGAAMPKGFDRTCTRCGWDNQVGLRKCVGCKGGVVTLHEMIGYGPIGGVVGLGGLIFWRLFGLFLGGMIICVLGALCGLITMLTLHYKCGGCGRRSEGRILSKDEKEQSGRRRLAYLVGTILLGAGAVGLFVLFIATMNALHS